MQTANAGTAPLRWLNLLGVRQLFKNYIYIYIYIFFFHKNICPAGQVIFTAARCWAPNSTGRMCLEVRRCVWLGGGAIVVPRTSWPLVRTQDPFGELWFAVLTAGYT